MLAADFRSDQQTSIDCSHGIGQYQHPSPSQSLLQLFVFNLVIQSDPYWRLLRQLVQLTILRANYLKLWTARLPNYIFPKKPRNCELFHFFVAFTNSVRLHSRKNKTQKSHKIQSNVEKATDLEKLDQLHGITVRHDYCFILAEHYLR